MRIAIIGGGYSGVAVAINILRRTLDEVLLTLIERADTTGAIISFEPSTSQASSCTPICRPTGVIAQVLATGT